MPTGNILERVIGLRPFTAFLAINVGVIAHASLTSFGYSNPAYWGLVVLPAMPVFAWPCIAVSDLRDRYGTAVRAQPNRLWAALAGVFVAHSCLVPILAMLPRDNVVFFAVALLAWGLGFLGPLYIFWTAARVLVEMEEQSRVSVDRTVGTFLLFFFLPIGILFLQRRIQRMAVILD